MRVSKIAFILCAAVILLAASASATGNDPCKVLTAEQFSRIMGYAATIDKTASNQMSCFYQGPAHSGGQFMILTETASGPGADAMLKRRGSGAASRRGRVGGSLLSDGV